MMATRVKDFLFNPVSIIPLVIFRIVFGLTMAFAAVRFWLKGWIEELYLNVPFQFRYYGFEWISLPSPFILYSLYFTLIVSALSIAAGLFYRLSAITYFLVFTYIELLDKSLYLNHYYFVSLISFLMIFIPANKALSLDIKRNPEILMSEIPNFFPFAIKLQLTIVYFFAGIAKLNSSWLLDAMPLRIWLPARANLPIIGPFLDWQWAPYLMSWSGMLYDLLIPFFLFWGRSRPVAYVTVVIFHVMTWLLFQIGVFPWVMIASTMIFFSHENYQWFLKRVNWQSRADLSSNLKMNRSLVSLFVVFFIIQICLPLRHNFYEGEVTWNEMGFRYSWNVMRVEKTAYVEFTCVDPKSHKTWKAYPSNYLSSIQEKQMAFQPDMILEFAHFLEKIHGQDLKVFAHVKVSLNGAESRQFVDSSVDLTEEEDSLFKAYHWVIN